MDIIQEFYTLRLEYYQKRKDYIVGSLTAEAKKLSNQARFISEKCSGELVVENKKRKTIVEELIKKGYDPDPLKEWKKKANKDDNDDEEQEEDEEEPQDNSKNKKPVDPGN